MIDFAREVAHVRYPVLAAGPGMQVPGMHVYCWATGNGTVPMTASLSIWLALNPPSALAVGWALMLLAMMSPLVISEIHHIRITCLARRRARSIALFVTGYGGVWMLCGAVLTGAVMVALTLAPGSFILATLAGLITCVWQASPFKQRCLNKCHDNRPLRVFGLEADLDAFRFGWTRGVWCAGSCSGLMLFPMLLPEGHLMAMAAVAILVFCERLENPEPPRWKMRGFGKAGRMIAARIRIRWWMVRRAFDLLPEQSCDPHPDTLQKRSRGKSFMLEIEKFGS
jgi:predicted metal-binding membrane protein